MRWTLSLVPLLMLSGCLAAGTDAAEGPGAEGAADAEGLRQGVVFFEQDYQILPNEPTALEVTVPEGARNVRVEMSVQPAPTAADEATVALSGCGNGHVTWSPGPNVVVSVGGSWREADLCGQAYAGARTMELDGGLTAMQGRIRLRADLP